jgi:mannosyl-oligosaccharide alpha-1,2-mannosidase
LSELTGDAKYDDAVTRIMGVVEWHSKNLARNGLYPALIDIHTGAFCNDHITIGAYGDSFYEYLLKQFVMTKDERYKKLFEESVSGIVRHMLVKPSKNWFIAELVGQTRVNKVDHLACFASGMFALAHTLNASAGHDVLEIAEEFGKTCYESYRMTTSGLSPENFLIDEKSGAISPGVRKYLLRPETVESLFILYRVTGNPKYQEYGWNIFEAIDKHCKVPYGYSGITCINTVPPVYDDHQQSFFLSETLKYLYLLFSPVHILPLDKWVFNTEAHPFRIVS